MSTKAKKKKRGKRRNFAYCTFEMFQELTPNHRNFIILIVLTEESFFQFLIKDLWKEIQYLYKLIITLHDAILELPNSNRNKDLLGDAVHTIMQLFSVGSPNANCDLWCAITTLGLIAQRVLNKKSNYLIKFRLQQFLQSSSKSSLWSKSLFNSWTILLLSQLMFLTVNFTKVINLPLFK